MCPSGITTTFFPTLIITYIVGVKTMYKNKKVTAVILCAGSGTRFNSELNKVYIEINKRPIISYSIEKFSNNKYIDEIIMVTKPDEEELCNKAVNEFCKLGSIKKTYGGDTRKDSVHNALNIATGDIAIIHDGARPLLTDKMISDCIESMDVFKGATIGVKSKDTIKITDDEGIIISTTERKNTWIIQTPQCFDKELLLKGHEIETEHGVEITDDCMIMEILGYPVKVIEGEYTNIKVTIKEDLDLVEKFLNN